MSSIWGKLFTVSTWGESHGPAVGAVIDGCPAGIELDEAYIQKELDKRRPGQSDITTQRDEADKVEILSGMFEGKTTGTPISILVKNTDQRSKDYSNIAEVFRPSHADYTYHSKYGNRDYRGGGRSSARETIGRVAAGAIAKKILKEKWNIDVLAYVSRVAGIEFSGNFLSVNPEIIESNKVRAPDLEIAAHMEKAILAARKEGDSLGGSVTFLIKNVPPGVGEPIFHRTEAELARAFLSIPATKGFEIGSGFEGSYMKGSEHNDVFFMDGDKVATRTNRSGGIQGGVTNGMPIYGKIAFKPTATIIKNQQTVNAQGKEVEFLAKGRHDPCVLPRAVVIVEAMAALTILDLLMEWAARK